jgi:hypothetical protein
MIVVAVVAFVIAGERMRWAAAHYCVQAEYHALREASFRREAMAWREVQPWVLGRLRGRQALDVILVPEFSECHARLRRKYEHAARYPWLPAEADPSPPGRIPSGASGEP